MDNISSTFDADLKTLGQWLSKEGGAVSIQEASQALHLTCPQINSLIEKGTLRSFRFARMNVVSRKALAELTNQKPHKTKSNWPQIFLKHLEETGCVAAAARKARVAQATVYHHRDVDADFEILWNEAMGAHSLQVRPFSLLAAARMGFGAHA